MSHPSTTREALIVEALGETASLMRQVEALLPALEESRLTLAEAHSGLASQLVAFEAQVLALAEKAKVETVKHILTRTDEAARHAVDTQAQAMAQAAKQLFVSVVDPRLQQLARVIAHQVDRVDHPWERCGRMQGRRSPRPRPPPPPRWRSSCISGHAERRH